VAETRGKEFASALNKVWLAMLAVEDDEARSPLLDSDGNSLSHSDQTARASLNKLLTQVPENLAALSEQEQIAWAEMAAEKLCEGLSLPEIKGDNRSEEENN
jgi:hypothetical protein